MSEAWYCRAFGQELGPMSFADLAVLVERKDVLPADLIKCGADGPWGPAEGMPGLFAAEAKAPSSLFQANSAADDAVSTNANSDDAELAVDEDGSEKIAANTSPNSADSKPVDDPLIVPPSSPDVAPAPAGRRRLTRIAAAAAALVLLGASAGGVTGWLVPAGASSPTSEAVNQQTTDQLRIEALRRQIAELQSERERLAQAAQARSPKPSAGDPAAGESTGAGADSPLPPPAAASEEAAKPAADDSAKGSESPTANAGPAEGPNPPTKSEQPAAAGRPAMPPTAPPTAASVSPTANAAAPQQSADLQRQRLQLLKQIYEQRHDLLQEFADLEAKRESVSKSITNAEGELIAINGLGAILTAKMAAEQLRPDRNLGLIATWAGEYAALDVQASAVKLNLEQLQTQYANVAEQLKEAGAEAVQLRSAWLAVVDPFGQLDSGDKDSAIAAFTEWVTLEPKAPWAWLARGFAYWQLGRLDEALSDFNAAVNLQGPMVSNSLAARGGLLHAMHKSKEAMADFGKALKANKTDGMVYLFRGRAAAADEKYQSAQRDFKTAINLDAKDAEARRNMALLLAACPKDRYRNGKRAVEYAQAACELTQWKSSSALDTLAAACAEAGQFDQACDWAEKAAALARGANRGQCLARLKQYQAHQPLRLDWKNQNGNPSAAAEAPVSR